MGVATCETVSEPVGAPTITADYSGIDNFNASSATGITQTVGNADTTTTVDVAPLNTSFTYGDDITFTATIAPVTPATVAPDAGTVSFTADGVQIDDCQLLDVSTGTATCVTGALDAGIPSINADYSGTDGFNTSSGSTSVTIAPADSATVVASSANPSVLSQTVTFTATISSDGGTPTGSVDFTADDEAIDGCSDVTTFAGVATCDTAALPVGANHQIVASFTSNDGNHDESSSEAFEQDVAPADTSVGVISDNASSSYSQPVTFSASITSTGAATATPNEGTVTFRSGTTTITGCAAQVVSAGVASCTTGALAVGTSTITATYNANGNYNEGVSNDLSQDVAQASTIDRGHLERRVNRRR